MRYFIAAIICGLTLTLSAQELDSKDLTTLTGYKYGDSRLSLSRIQKVVRTASQDKAKSKQAAEALLKTLAAAETEDAKDFICRQLVYVGGQESVPALSELLTCKSERLGELACLALNRNPHPDAAAALRAGATKLAGRRRNSVIFALGQKRDKLSVSFIVGQLSSKDKDTVLTAAAALSQIGGNEAAEQIHATWKKDPKSAELTDALLIVLATLEGDHRKKAMTIYKDIYSNSSKGYIKLGALRQMALTNPTDATDLIMTAVKSSDKELSKGAIGIVSSLKGDGLARAANELLPKLDPESQVVMLNSIRESNATAAAETVRKMVNSPNAQVKIAAIRALGAVGNADKDLALLVGKLEADPDAAVAALSKLPGDNTTNLILAKALAAAGKTRVYLTNAIAARAGDDAVAAMFAMIHGEDLKSVRAALKGIGARGKMPELKKLMAAMNGTIEPSACRRYYEYAAAEIARSISKGKGGGELVLNGSGASTPDGKASAIRIVGVLQDNDSLSKLVSATKSADDKVKDAAIRALANWATADALMPLLEVAKAAKSTTHHVLAMRGYIRLLKAGAGGADIEKLYKIGRKTARREEEKALLKFSGVSIGGLKAKSSGKYIVHPNGLKVGAKWATDRDYTFTNIPATILGATYIQVTMNDRAQKGADFLAFTVPVPVEVFVAFDKRAKKLPKWMAGWAKVGETLKSTAKGSDLNLYSKKFPAGTVQLGGGSAPGVGAMYSVAVKAQ